MKPTFEHIELENEGVSFKSYLIKQADFPFQWHYHPELELTCIIKGKGIRLVGDKVADFEKGDLVFLGGNLPHTWVSEGQEIDEPEGAQVIGIQFKDDLLSEKQLSHYEYRNIRHLFKNSGRGIHFFGETAKSVAKKMEVMVKMEGLEKLTNLYLILDQLGASKEFEVLASGGYQPTTGEKQEKRIDIACSFIHEHFARTIKLAELAEVTHMTETSFCRFFKKMTGKSFSDYVNDLRVARSCKLLTESNSSVNEIAYASGFNSITHFNRIFLRKKGFSPSRFRAHYRSHS